MKVQEKAKAASKPAKEGSFDIRKILVAVDLSPHSEKTAAYGAEFAKRVDASVTLLHVFLPEPRTQFASELMDESFERNRRLLAAKLTNLMEQIREAGVKCDLDFRVGDPAEEITLAAEGLHADLIITGCHHPGLVGRLFGMDQAPRIVHRAACPTLLYHEGSE